MKDTSFVQFITDQLFDIDSIRFKPMFGGFGLYSGDIFFGIVSDEKVYFKTDEHTRSRYLDAGSVFFQPNDTQALKRYYEVPIHIVENPTDLVKWAQESINSVIAEITE
jgi:DNA transformation protein